MSNSRLKNYALTAGGTAALATTGLAGADIQTSSGPTPIALHGAGTSVNLFSVAGVNVNARNRMRGSWSGTGDATALLITNGGSSANMKLANSGSSISRGWYGSSLLSHHVYFSGRVRISTYGSLNLGTNLVGFAVAASGEFYYGWIAYDLSISQDRHTFTVNSWAYNDVAGEGIIAGQNQAAGSSAVPGLGGLAALAIGAAGVRSRRQRTVA